tara:strand:+ start:1479 stop:1700 length:222 start_codon:yes stop_codon:yes gene_type:complete
MTEKGRSKKELENDVKLLSEKNEELTSNLVQVSEGYQNLLNANQNLTVLAARYEETINLLTARLLEARQTQNN